MLVNSLDYNKMLYLTFLFTIIDNIGIKFQNSRKLNNNEILSLHIIKTIEILHYLLFL